MQRRFRTALIGVPVRSVDMVRLLDTVLVFAVATILFIRTDLWLTHYPQLGGHGLHIAHLLWGGLLMLIALVILLSYVNQRARAVAAVPAGIGLGLFIDELGKFITSDNNYFYKPTAAIVYCFFVVSFLLIRLLSRRHAHARQDSLVNALELMKTAAVGTMTEAQKRQALEQLDEVDQSDPFVRHLREAIEGIRAAPTRPARLPGRLWGLLRRWFAQLTERPWFTRALFAFFAIWTLASVVQIVLLVVFAEAGLEEGEVFAYLGGITNDPLGTGELDFVQWANLAASIVAASFSALGLVQIARGRLTSGLAMLERALLVSIFFVQVFAFFHSQFAAAFGFALDVLLFLAVRTMLDRELERDALERPTTPSRPGAMAAAT